MTPELKKFLNEHLDQLQNNIPELLTDAKPNAYLYRELVQVLKTSDVINQNEIDTSINNFLSSLDEEITKCVNTFDIADIVDAKIYSGTLQTPYSKVTSYWENIESSQYHIHIEITIPKKKEIVYSGTPLIIGSTNFGTTLIVQPEGATSVDALQYKLPTVLIDLPNIMTKYNADKQLTETMTKVENVCKDISQILGSAANTRFWRSDAIEVTDKIIEKIKQAVGTKDKIRYESRFPGGKIITAVKIPGVKASISFEVPYITDPKLLDTDIEAEPIITQIKDELNRLQKRKDRENSSEVPEFTGNISEEIQRLAKLAGVPVAAHPYIDRRKDSRRYKFSTGRKVATKKECNDLYNLLEEAGIKVKEVYSKDNKGLYPYYNELLVEIFV